MSETIEHARGVGLFARPDVWACLAIALAVGTSLVATAPLEVPAEIDHYRDMGAAQALLDGRWGEDPAFLGETSWYPPLLPALTALLAFVSRQPLPFVYVHLGPLLNALGPIAFYLLAKRLFEGWSALFSLLGFLFIVACNAPTLTQASYSPWVWPVLFAQGLFYLTFRAWLIALEKRTAWSAMASGAWLGLTFLAHPAPAVLLVITFTLATAIQAFTEPSNRGGDLQRLLTVGGVSALVCAPFLVPLVLRYGMHTENSLPSRFGGVWPREIIGAHWSFRSIGVGAGALWLPLQLRPLRRIDGRWLALVLALLASVTGLFYGIVVQKLELRGVLLPLLFPTFHFQFYLLALECLLFGPGVVWIARRLFGYVSERGRTNPAFSAALRFGHYWSPLSALLLLLLSAPSYQSREDFTHWPAESRRLAADEATRAVYEWARTHLTASDVVLADTRLGMFGIVAAGHAVVSTYQTMSNPYVAFEPREAARQAMFAQLRSGDIDAFSQLASSYGVTYVIAETNATECCALTSIDSPRLRIALSAPSVTVYALSDS